MPGFELDLWAPVIEVARWVAAIALFVGAMLMMRRAAREV